ncbi:BTAD domain-containing putative transcriptional regulator [Actinoplanes couchii]|uniref:SARP family transcriptional regulator n=1 Tax=Actinoplanes couchii TaxID=403638 RepID=A0ABQ3XFP4_9ACTN|nr:BTAD domain-containing putative transcriptional regulator [Actinoplanes couchii]MDR6321741.1 DNA-binding SARP family transcriptional activator/tetratricopeptide (TPR) repeat protein/DNA-binding XRE family transcriptional regulator [Actinoplanes couchii]GID57302.1 SARP family transcriptional regulator [Actinoplanes couchii]
MASTGNTSGDDLREQRVRLGLTQEDVALRAGVSVRSVRNLERGAGGVPRQRTLERLAAAVGLTGLGGAGVIRVSVLGPLTVHDGDREVPIGSAMQRRLLGLLALHPGQPVRVADIVDVLWGDRPPATHTNLIHVYVGALRKILGASAVVTGPDGYRLDLERDRIDLARFGDLLRQRDHERALDCWRGPVDPVIRQLPAAVAAANQRITATLAFADQAIETRRYDAALHRLGPLSQEEPLHEGLHARLLLALAGSGRQAEALRHYADVRARIVRELGVEPGPRLTEAHLGVLRQELPGAPARRTAGVIPAELPPATVFLAGRVPAVSSLNRLLIGPADGRPAIAAISGGPGTGKTTLAVHWAHTVRDRFPDGQLFVNLRGFHPAGAVVSPEQAVRTFLESLGVEPQKVPQSWDGQVNLYRSLLAARRVLVVLDNARDAEHVRSLLPGSGGSAAVVTSRNRLTGLLVMDGGTSVGLSVLRPEDSYALVSRRLGAARTAAEPEAAAEIGRLCGHLPLALAVVAARAAVQTELPLASFVEHLRAERDRLDVLGDDEATIDVRAVFSWSYGVLTPAAARLFRLLGAHTGTDIGAGVAASLAGWPIERVRGPLAELVRGSLIEQESNGRFTMHDLLRVYALETAAAVDGDDGLRAATRRMHDWYVAGAVGAGQILDPHRMTGRLGRPPVEPAHFDSTGEAVAWFTAERPNLLAVQTATGDAGAWWVAWGMTEYLQRGGHWPDWVSTQLIALAAARRIGDVYLETTADRSLGSAYARLGDFGRATSAFERVLAQFQAIGDVSRAASVHLNLGWVADRQRDFATALHHARQALDLARSVGHTRGEADGLNTVGWYLIQLGEHRSALEPCRQALALHEAIGNRSGQADTWDTLGYVHHHLGDHGQALIAYRQALSFYVGVADRYHESLVLNHMGDTHRAAGDVEAARESWRGALLILDDLGHAEAGEVRDKLATVDSDKVDR